jgi:hypothetical protein
MAFISQADKAKIAPTIKALCAKYGVKGSLSVRNHSALVLTIKSGKIDFIGNFNKTVIERDPTGNRHINPAVGEIQVNPYHCQDHFTGKARDFVVAAVAALKGPDYFDKSDMMSDYFHCSHYIDINVGKWNQPYVVTA